MIADLDIIKAGWERGHFALNWTSHVDIVVSALFGIRDINGQVSMRQCHCQMVLLVPDVSLLIF